MKNYINHSDKLSNQQFTYSLIKKKEEKLKTQKINRIHSLLFNNSICNDIIIRSKDYEDQYIENKYNRIVYENQLINCSKSKLNANDIKSPFSMLLNNPDEYSFKYSICPYCLNDVICQNNEVFCFNHCFCFEVDENKFKKGCTVDNLMTQLKNFIKFHINCDGKPTLTINNDDEYKVICEKCFDWY